MIIIIARRRPRMRIRTRAAQCHGSNDEGGVMVVSKGKDGDGATVEEDSVKVMMRVVSVC